MIISYRACQTTNIELKVVCRCLGFLKEIKDIYGNLDFRADTTIFWELKYFKKKTID